MSEQEQVVPAERGTGSIAGLLGQVLFVLFLLFVFLVGVKCLGSGFKLLGKDLLDSFFAAAANPFVGLMVGILATTLVQSSSVTTAMIVGLVAAPENPLPVATAIPMIMGANIGTTVTNTMVSMAYLGRSDEFKRAFSVATCHDYFNFMAVALLLPLELATGFLRHSATGLASVLSGVGGYKYKSPLKVVLKEATKPIQHLAEWLFEDQIFQACLVILISGVLIYTALLFLVKTMRSSMQSRVEIYISRVLGKNAIISMIVGVVVTVMVQSSSVTTSLLVPLAGAGVLSLRHAFPITLGANIGTTVTALLASLAVTGPNAQAGIIIALAHLIFNMMGVLLIYPAKRIREIPLRASERFADLAAFSKGWALFYVVILFYGLPAIFAALNAILR